MKTMRHTLFNSVLALMLCAPRLALATTYTVGLTNAHRAQYGQTYFQFLLIFRWILMELSLKLISGRDRD